MSVLAIDIGNSRIGVGVFSLGKSDDPARRLVRHNWQSELKAAVADLWQAKKINDGPEAYPTSVVIASVVPDLTTQVQALVKTELHLEDQRIGQDLKIPMKTNLTDESTLGVDRLLAALCAYVNTQQACVVISAGTALTVDYVDDDGIFQGGAITTGLQLGARALHEFTAQLPLASLDPPQEPCGRNTAEALNLGLYASARGAVRELVESYAGKLGHWPHVVATGGDAQRLLANSGLVDSLIPDLVLQGAALVWEHHKMED